MRHANGELYLKLASHDYASAEALVAKIPAGVFYGDLGLSPEWDSLRGDPRLQKILAGLEPKTAYN